MSGIHVLSDILKGGNKLEKTSTPKGKEFSDSPENAVAVFAAMLSGCMNSNMDSKGQNSKAGQELEEKQSTQNPVQSVRNSNEQESILGYGNFALSNLFQPMLLGDLPAGKEANSGNDVSQGPGGLTIANASVTKAPIVSENMELALLNLVSWVSDEVSAQSGMTTSKLQGTNPAITELDKYRQVITNLLVALSGEITDPSLKGERLSLEGAGTMELRQVMAKIVQGWMTVTEDNGEEISAFPNSPVASSAVTTDFRQELAKGVQGWMMVSDDVNKGDVNKGDLSTREQNGLQRLLERLTRLTVESGNNPELKTKAAILLAAFYPSLIEEAGDAKVPNVVNEALTSLKGIGIDLEASTTAPKKTGFLTNVLQKSVGTGLQESKVLNNFRDTFNGELNKANPMKSVELFDTKDSQNQPSSSGVGVVANIVPLTIADGKIVVIPVWEQISTVVREQVMTKQQALKELDIQLHPADLGKIQISLRWESGQVHMQVQASEAATGQLLQNQLSELRQNLMNQGVNCGSLQMGQGDRQQQPPGEEAQRTLQQTLPNEEEDLIPLSNPFPLGQDGINRVNVTA